MGVAKKPVVLIIDDDAEMCNMLGQLMSDRFTVFASPVSWGLVSAICTLQVDVVITDFYMPGTQGLDLIAEIKREYPFAPIVSMTGAMWNQSEEDEAISAGASMVAYKPFGNLKAFAQSVYELATQPK